MNFQSQSGSSQVSSGNLFSVDRHLRDLKLHITENKEPRQVVMLRRVIYTLVAFLTITAILTFSWHMEEGAKHSDTMRSALKALEMQSKFVQL